MSSCSVIKGNESFNGDLILRYNAVPNTNLLFVWAYCTDSLCECDEPEYNLDTIVDEILDPCAESDENYNPASHCTSEVEGIRQRTRNAALRGARDSDVFILGVGILFVYICQGV